MKKITAAFLLWLIPAIALSATTFVWQQPATNTDGTALTDLKGNKIYCGSAAGDYTIIKDAGLPAAAGKEARYPIYSVITADGVYYCAVTAYDDDGNESGKSNEVIYPLDQTAPVVAGGLRVE